MITLVSFTQLANTLVPMLVTLVLIVMPVRLEQDWNALFPILVMLFGITMLVSLVRLRKAFPPMLVTGRPLIVSGIISAPPAPVELVMVIVPLLAGKV